MNYNLKFIIGPADRGAVGRGLLPGRSRRPEPKRGSFGRRKRRSLPSLPATEAARRRRRLRAASAREFFAAAVPQQLLRRAKRFGRLGEQRSTIRARRVELSGGGAVADKADRQRLIDSERLGEEQGARRAPARHLRQEQRARRLGHQPKIDERQREARPFLGHDEVAVEQHRRPDPDAIAVDRGDQRRLAAASARRKRHTAISPPSRAEASRKSARSLPAAKSWPSPRKVTSGSRVGRRLLDGVGERGIHRDRDGIAALGPGERHREDRALLFDPDMFAHLPLPESGDAPVPPAMAAPSTKAGTHANHEILRRHCRNRRNPRARRNRAARRGHHQPVARPQVRPRLPRGRARDRRRRQRARSRPRSSRSITKG